MLPCIIFHGRPLNVKNALKTGKCGVNHKRNKNYVLQN